MPDGAQMGSVNKRKRGGGDENGGRGGGAGAGGGGRGGRRGGRGGGRGGGGGRQQQPRREQTGGEEFVQPAAADDMEAEEEMIVESLGEVEVADESKPFMTKTTFVSMSNLICRESLQALQQAGFTYMTQVQEAAIPIAVTGKDLIAKARTGTGKTLGFLMPSIERLHAKKLFTPPGKIAILVISPTRELAMQTMKEAQMLLKQHRYRAQCVIGGTNIKSEQRNLNQGGVDILVATPGRLLDHIQNSRGVRELLESVSVLVLDEADKLLEMGFKKDIDTIVSYLPPTGHRQTLLFSATMPDQLAQLVRNIIAPTHQTIDTVGDDQTNVQVKQEYVIAPFKDQIPIFYQMVKEHMASERDYKIIAFFVTARMTQFMANLFNDCLGIPTLEIHSRKSQSQRTSTSDKFRKGKNVIMFSSDVSARGVDYPDVTPVLQMGLPADSAQYIHRLGRTARAGKEGSGLLLLADFEAKFLGKLRELPITEYKPKRPLATYETMPAEMMALQGHKGARGLKKLQDGIGQAYQSWLGYYNGHSRYLNWSKEQLVAQANELATILGADRPPKLTAQCIGKMGLRGVRGLAM
jgi:ATP-dependent RNA helicase MSS116